MAKTQADDDVALQQRILMGSSSSSEDNDSDGVADILESDEETVRREKQAAQEEEDEYRGHRTQSQRRRRRRRRRQKQNQSGNHQWMTESALEKHASGAQHRSALGFGDGGNSAPGYLRSSSRPLVELTGYKDSARMSSDASSTSSGSDHDSDRDVGRNRGGARRNTDSDNDSSLSDSDTESELDTARAELHGYEDSVPDFIAQMQDKKRAKHAAKGAYHRASLEATADDFAMPSPTPRRHRENHAGELQEGEEVLIPDRVLRRRHQTKNAQQKKGIRRKASRPPPEMMQGFALPGQAELLRSAAVAAAPDPLRTQHDFSEQDEHEEEADDKAEESTSTRLDAITSASSEYTYVSGGEESADALDYLSSGRVEERTTRALDELEVATDAAAHNATMPLTPDSGDASTLMVAPRPATDDTYKEGTSENEGHSGDGVKQEAVAALAALSAAVDEANKAERATATANARAALQKLGTASGVAEGTQEGTQEKEDEKDNKKSVNAPSLSSSDADTAAIAIQAMYRGLQARRNGTGVLSRRTGLKQKIFVNTRIERQVQAEHENERNLAAYLATRREAQAGRLESRLARAREARERFKSLSAYARQVGPAAVEKERAAARREAELVALRNKIEGLEAAVMRGRAEVASAEEVRRRLEREVSSLRDERDAHIAAAGEDARLADQMSELKERMGRLGETLREEQAKGNASRARFAEERAKFEHARNTWEVRRGAMEAELERATRAADSARTSARAEAAKTAQEEAALRSESARAAALKMRQREATWAANREAEREAWVAERDRWAQQHEVWAEEREAWATRVRTMQDEMVQGRRWQRRADKARRRLARERRRRGRQFALVHTAGVTVGGHQMAESGGAFVEGVAREHCTHVLLVNVVFETGATTMLGSTASADVVVLGARATQAVQGFSESDDEDDGAGNTQEDEEDVQLGTLLCGQHVRLSNNSSDSGGSGWAMVEWPFPGAWLDLKKIGPHGIRPLRGDEEEQHGFSGGDQVGSHRRRQGRQRQQQLQTEATKQRETAALLVHSVRELEHCVGHGQKLLDTILSSSLTGHAGSPPASVVSSSVSRARRSAQARTALHQLRELFDDACGGGDDAVDGDYNAADEARTHGRRHTRSLPSLGLGQSRQHDPVAGGGDSSGQAAAGGGGSRESTWLQSQEQSGMWAVPPKRLEEAARRNRRLRLRRERRGGRNGGKVHPLGPRHKLGDTSRQLLHLLAKVSATSSNARGGGGSGSGDELARLTSGGGERQAGGVQWVRCMLPRRRFQVFTASGVRGTKGYHQQQQQHFRPPQDDSVALVQHAQVVVYRFPLDGIPTDMETGGTVVFRGRTGLDGSVSCRVVPGCYLVEVRSPPAMPRRTGRSGRTGRHGTKHARRLFVVDPARGHLDKPVVDVLIELPVCDSSNSNAWRSAASTPEFDDDRASPGGVGAEMVGKQEEEEGGGEEEEESEEEGEAAQQAERLPAPVPPPPPPLSLKDQLKLKQLEAEAVNALTEKRKEGALGKYRDRLLVGARVEKQVAQQEAHKQAVETWEQTEKARQRQRLEARLRRKRALKRSKTTRELGGGSDRGSPRHE